MKTKLYSGVGAAVLALSAASAGPSFAQEAAPPSDATSRTQTAEASSGGDLIDQVVVTARRHEELLQSVPVAVTALSAAALEERHIVDVAALQGAVPSLTFTGRSSQAGRTGLSFALRGLRSSAVPTYSSEIVRSPFAVSNFYDLQAVEVSQGPQGTLFGANSTAGAVVIRPNTPTDHFEAALSARAGNYNLYGGSAMVNYPVGDSAALRIAVDGEKRDGIVDRPVGDALDSDTHFGGRISFRVTPNDTFQNLTVVEGYTYDQVGPYFFPLANRPCTGTPVPVPPAAFRANGTQASCFYTGSPVTLAIIPLPSPSPPFVFSIPALPNIGTEFAQAQADGPFFSRQTTDPYVSNRSFAFSNVTDFGFGPAFGDSLGNVSVRSILGFTEDIQRTFLDFDGFQERVLDSHVQQVSDNASFEGQLRGTRDDGTLDWVLGVFLRNTDIEAHNDVTIFNESPTIKRFFVGDTTANVDNLAFYAQASWEFIPNFTLTAGYRATNIDLTQNTRLVQNGACNAATVGTPGAYDFGVGGTGPFACGRIQKASFDEPSYTLGLDWKLNDDTLIYIVTRRGFAQGGFNNTPPPQDVFAPEILKDVELGLKRDWHFDGAQLRTNVAVFHNDYQDVQRANSTFVAGTGPGTGNVAFTSNAAAATLDGVELESELAFAGGLSFRLNASHIEASYDKYLLVIPPATTPIDVSGNKIAQAPEWTGTFGIDYHRDVSGLGTLSATVDYNYQSTTYFQDVNLTNQLLSNTLDPTTTQKAYGLINARLGLSNIFGSNVSVDVWGKNLTDETYFVQMSNSGTLGLSNGQTGLPRMFGATIRATF